MATENKWKANLAKVALLKQFPGLLGSWEALKGKTIEAVITLKGKQGAAAIICSDGTFTVAPPMAGAVRTRRALTAGRSLLESKHATRSGIRPAGEDDKDALRQARLEKITAPSKTIWRRYRN